LVNGEDQLTKVGVDDCDVSKVVVIVPLNFTIFPWRMAKIRGLITDEYLTNIMAKDKNVVNVSSS
jgi:hypothetical protein